VKPQCLLLQELATIVKDNYVYARVAKYVGNRSLFDESKLEVHYNVPRLAGVSASMLTAAWVVRV
jgi:RNA processing factor Prp31